MKRILIVEDEFFLLESMLKFMNGMENVRAVGFPNLGDAIDSIANHTPDLIFSDINLPDGSGLELITYLNQRNLKIPLVFVSAFISDYRNRIPEASHITLLEKPVSMKRLVALAEEKLSEGSGDYQFKLSDYLQISAMGGHSVQLHCGDQGTITLVNGDLWTAKDPFGQGEEAFKRLVAEAEVHGHNGYLTCKRIDEKDIGSRTITGSLDNLLLNAVFEEEEQQREHPQERLAQTKLNGESLQTLLDEGVDRLLHKDFQAALELFTRAKKLSPKHALVNANIKRLAQLGFVSQEDAS